MLEASCQYSWVTCAAVRRPPGRYQLLTRSHSLSGQPVQSRETIMSQAIVVADHLVDQIGLWRVERHGVVPNVLGGVENSVC
jgi:hypothetical protein